MILYLCFHVFCNWFNILYVLYIYASKYIFFMYYIKNAPETLPLLEIFENLRFLLQLPLSLPAPNSLGQAPLRETLGLFGASPASRSHTVALFGLLQAATRASHPIKLPHAQDDVQVSWVTSCPSKGKRSIWSGSTPLGWAQPKCRGWNVLLLLMCKGSTNHCPVSAPDGVPTTIWWALQPHGGPN